MSKYLHAESGLIVEVTEHPAITEAWVYENYAGRRTLRLPWFETAGGQLAIPDPPGDDLLVQTPLGAVRVEKVAAP